MKQLIAMTALLVSLPACAPRGGPEAQEEVKAVLDSFYGAMKTGDSAKAMSHIAQGALFIESGRLETRDEYEKNHLPLDIGFEKQVNGKREYRQVNVQGDTAWVIAVTDFVGTFDGAPVDFVSSQLAVLTRDTGQWLIRSIHWSSMRR